MFPIKTQKKKKRGIGNIRRIGGGSVCRGEGGGVDHTHTLTQSYMYWRTAQPYIILVFYDMTGSREGSEVRDTRLESKCASLGGVLRGEYWGTAQEYVSSVLIGISAQRIYALVFEKTAQKYVGFS